ncbi:MAG: DNA repair protein RecO [Flavobacteriales bacterium]
MFDKTKAIILKKTALQGNGVIVKMYTQEFGVKSYFGRVSKKARNLYLPLSIINITAYNNPKKNIQNIKDYELVVPFRSIYQDIFKSNILLFINEILNQVIQEEQQNLAKFQFLENSLMKLENEELSMDFHLIFLIQLTQFLGFEPSMDSDDLYFDLEEGELTNILPVHSNFLDKIETLDFKSLYNTAFGLQSLTGFDNKTRKRMLQVVVSYYKYHTDMRDLKSLQVLETVFN